MKILFFLAFFATACSNPTESLKKEAPRAELKYDLLESSFGVGVVNDDVEIQSGESLVDFGTISLGSNLTKTIIFTAKTNLTNFSIDSFKSLSIFKYKTDNCPANLLKNRSCKLELSFKAEAEGEQTESALLGSSEIIFLMNVTQPEPVASLFAVSPESVNMGDFSGLTKTASINIQNSGKVDQNVALDFTELDTKGILYSHNCPVSLKPNRICQVKVSYSSTEQLIEDLSKQANLVLNTTTIIPVSVVHKASVVNTASISWNKSELDFGLVTTKTKRANIATALAEVSGLTLSSLPSGVIFSKLGCSTILKKNRSCSIEVEIDPAIATASSFPLTITYSSTTVSSSFVINAEFSAPAVSYVPEYSEYGVCSAGIPCSGQGTQERTITSCQKMLNGVPSELVDVSNCSSFNIPANTSKTCLSPAGNIEEPIANGNNVKYCDEGSIVRVDVGISCNPGYIEDQNQCISTGIQYEKMYFSVSSNQSSHGSEVTEINSNHELNYLGDFKADFGSRGGETYITMVANSTIGIIKRNYNNELIFKPSSVSTPFKDANLLSYRNYHKLIDGQWSTKYTKFPESYNNQSIEYVSSYLNSDIFYSQNPVTSEYEVWSVTDSSQSLIFTTTTLRTRSFLVHDNLLYFIAFNQSNENTLFVFDGSSVTTVASASVLTDSLVRLSFMRGKAYAVSGQALYQLNEGVFSNIVPSGFSVTTAFMFKDSGNIEYLALSYRNLSTIGTELAIFDGNNFHVFDIVPGTGSSNSVPFLNFKGKLLITATLPFISGSQGGAELVVYDPRINTSSLSAPENLTLYDLDRKNLTTSVNKSSSPSNFYIDPTGNYVFFSGKRGDQSIESTTQSNVIFMYDGVNVSHLQATTARQYNVSTKQMTNRADLLLYPNLNMREGMAAVGSKLYYRVSEATTIGDEIGIYDFTDNSLTIIDIFAGSGRSGADSFYVQDNNLYFLASRLSSASSGAIFKIDTESADIKIKSATYVHERGGVDFFGYFFDKFIATVDGFYPEEFPGGSSMKKLYTYSSDLDEYEFFSDNSPQAGLSPIEFKDSVYYVGYSTVIGNELIKLTESGTLLVSDLNEGPNSGVTTALNIINPTGNPGEEKIIFGGKTTAGATGLFTYSGAGIPEEIYANLTFPSTPNTFQVINGKLYFIANDGVNGFELWVSDGTGAGTRMIKNINPATNQTVFISFPLVEINAQIYFRANDGVSGYELWVTDGTEEGTRIVQDLLVGSGTGLINSEMIKFKDKLYFSGGVATNDYEVYSYDGVSFNQETNLSTTGSSSPKNFVVMNDKLYFQANATGFGVELCSIGGEGEPPIVYENFTGSFNPSNITEFRGKLYMMGKIDSTFYRLYSFDGVSFEIVPEPVPGIYTSNTGILNVLKVEQK